MVNGLNCPTDEQHKTHDGRCFTKNIGHQCSSVHELSLAETPAPGVSALSIQRATPSFSSSIQRPVSAHSTQHSALSTQHSALGTQHPALSIQHSASSTQHYVPAGALGSSCLLILLLRHTTSLIRRIESDTSSYGSIQRLNILRNRDTSNHIALRARQSIQA